MKLYKLEHRDWHTFFGEHTVRDRGKPSSECEDLIDRDVTVIAQTPNCDAFLLLSNTTYNELELLDTAPSGFDFTYCQEWGLEVTQAKIDRAIAEISA